MQLDNTDFLQAPRIQQLKEQIASSESESDKRRFLTMLTTEIIKAINNIASQKFDDGVSVENFDEVTAALRNELARANKPLQQLLAQLNITAAQQSKLISDIETKAQSDFRNEFQPIVIKRHKTVTHIDNLHEVPLTEDVSVNNFSELTTYLQQVVDKISALKLNVTLPAPQVTVNPTAVNIPETVLNIPAIDLEPMISALDKILKVLRSNNKSNPLAVRLTDGSDWLKKLVEVQKETSRAVAAFAGGNDQMRLVDINRTVINPRQQPPDTLKAFANVAASQTDSSIVAAVTGKVIRVISMVSVAGATATNLTFNSKPAGSGVAISPLFANGANGGEVLPYNEKGWFDTVISEGLTVNTGAGATTGILVTYILV